MTGRCSSCEALMINGVYCHETGCPDAWQDYQVTCKWCGAEFSPGHSQDAFCSEDCAECYHS